MSLVQQPTLAGAGLGGQRRPEETPLGLQQLPQPPQKCGVGRRQLPRQVLEIHVHSREVFPEHRLQHFRRQMSLGLVVCQNEGRPPRIELPRLRQSGQVHHRLRPPFPGRRQHRFVVQGQEAPLRRNAIGEGGQGGKIGQLLRQQLRGDKGVGIAVEHTLPQFFIKVGNHQRLALRQRLPAAQLPIVPPQPPDAGSIAGGNRGQSLPRHYGVDLPGKAHHQRLPHRQGQVRGHLIIGRQTLGRHAVTRGDGIHGFPRAYHMDCH